MLIEEACDVGRTDVFPTFQKSSCEYGYGIGVSLNQIGHHLGKLYFIFQRGDLSLLIGQQGRQGMEVVIVDTGDVRI